MTGEDDIVTSGWVNYPPRTYHLYKTTTARPRWGTMVHNEACIDHIGKKWVLDDMRGGRDKRVGAYPTLEAAKLALEVIR